MSSHAYMRAHTRDIHTNGLAKTRRGDPAATHARAFMHAYDMRRNVMKYLRRWWCSRTLAGGAGALWPSAGGRRGVCYTGSSGSSHKVHARASSCSTPGQIQSCVCVMCVCHVCVSCVCVSVCGCMYPWVALECRLTPKAKPHNNPSRTTPETLSKQGHGTPTHETTRQRINKTPARAQASVCAVLELASVCFLLQLLQLLQLPSHMSPSPLCLHRLLCGNGTLMCLWVCACVRVCVCVFVCVCV